MKFNAALRCAGVVVLTLAAQSSCQQQLWAAQPPSSQFQTQQQIPQQPQLQQTIPQQQLLQQQISLGAAANPASSAGPITPSAAPSTKSYLQWASPMDQGFSVQVRKGAINGTVDISILTTATPQGWLGFGWSDSGGMVNADMVMCWASADGTSATIIQKVGMEGQVSDVQPTTGTDPTTGAPLPPAVIPNTSSSRIYSSSSGSSSSSSSSSTSPITWLVCRFTRAVPSPPPTRFIWASSSQRPASNDPTGSFSLGMHSLKGSFQDPELLDPYKLASLIPDAASSSSSSSSSSAGGGNMLKPSTQATATGSLNNNNNTTNTSNNSSSAPNATPGPRRTASSGFSNRLIISSSSIAGDWCFSSWCLSATHTGGSSLSLLLTMGGLGLWLI